MFMMQYNDTRVKWYEIGLMLCVDLATLDAISDDINGMDRCLRKMLQQWLQTGRDKTWKVLEEALQNKIVGRPDIADKLPK